MAWFPFASAQAEGPGDPIRFEGWIRGQKIGSETARVERTGTTLTVTSEATWTLAGPPTEFRAVSRWEGDPPAPSAYELSVKTAGGPQTVRVTFSAGKAAMAADVGGRTVRKDADLPATPILLDNLLVGQYLILPRALDLLVGGTFTVVVPQVMQALPMTITPGATAVVSGPAGTESALTVTLEVAGVTTIVYVRASDREMVGVRVPLQQVELVRTGWTLPALVFPRPPYVDAARLRAEDDTLGSGPDALPATLCVPAAPAGALPAVVFVHGSGPNDRDETIGPNKVFRDLAEGLASRGILTYRYDKRTYAHATALDPGKVTLEIEVIDDALAAIARVRGRAEVDPKRVHLLGHSLGGMLGPEIARRDGNLGGLILLAAPGRPMDILLEEQFRHLTGLAGGAAEADATLDRLLAQLARLRAGTLPESEPLLGAPVSYWNAVRRVNAPAILRDLGLPVLVLQGERDYQVRMADFAAVSAAVQAAGNPSSLARSYPALNHLFIAGEGTSTPSEYSRPGFVDEKVVEDIAAWILGPR